MRPEPPLQRVWSVQLQEIVHLCWHREPKMRPSFTRIDEQVQRLRAQHGADMMESPAPRHSELDKMNVSGVLPSGSVV